MPPLSIINKAHLNVEVVDEAAKSRGLLFRVKDHGSQQVRKTLGITDADDDRSGVDMGR